MIYTEFLELPEYNKAEIFRYSGGKEQTPILNRIMDECIDECTDKIKARVCYAAFPLKIEKNDIDLSFTKVSSAALAKNLNSCSHAIVFAATIGIEIDRLIQKYSKLDLTKAVFMQAIGAERIEALCDAFCDKIKHEQEKNGLSIRPRFSAGYGDLSIELQRYIIKALDCNRKIGVALNESLLMSPSKSVTAIVGLSKKKQASSECSCANCNNIKCCFRKEEL